MYGVGDAVIGINPASDSLPALPALADARRTDGAKFRRNPAC
jgi:ethanolamine ammonia-lyase large subunit